VIFSVFIWLDAFPKMNNLAYYHSKCSKLQIEEKLQELRTEINRFYYKRRKNALTHEAGDFYLQHGRGM